MLKEPDYLIFDDLKAQTLNSLKLKQAKMNPWPFAMAEKPSVPVKAPAIAADAASAPVEVPVDAA